MHHQPAQPEETNLHTLELLQVRDGFAEPAGGFRRDELAGNGINIVPSVDFLPQVPAATVIHPAQVLGGIGAEGHSREECRRGNLADPIAGAAPPGIDGAIAHGIENFQRGNELARIEKFDVEP